MDMETRRDIPVEGEVVIPGTPWDRMPDEPESAYAHFLIYRDCGADRTVAKAADRAHKSRDHFHRLAATWQWIPRANAWDVEQFRLFAAASLDARREMIGRHASIGRIIMSLVQSRLMSIPVDELSPSELVRLADLAAKLERGAWAEEAALAGRGASTRDGIDLSSLDEGARLNRLEELRNELDRRITARRQLREIAAAGDSA